MIYNKWLTFFLGALFSTQVVAAEPQHSQMLSHKEWQTGKYAHLFSTTFENVPVDLNKEMQTKLMLSRSQPRQSEDISSIESLAVIGFANNETLTPVNGDLNIPSIVFALIKNNTDEYQTYLVTTTLHFCNTSTISCDYTHTSQDFVTVFPHNMNFVNHHIFTTYKLSDINRNVSDAVYPDAVDIEISVETQGMNHMFSTTSGLIRFKIANEKNS